MRPFRKQIIAIVVLLTMLGSYSCELTDTNINPNSPTSVPPNVLLPFNESRLARLMSGSAQVMAGIFMQYYEGIDNHPRQVQIYTLNEALYVDWNWNDYYDGPMINIRKMIEFAEESEAYYYTGIGKVLMALCLGNVTSLWGDVPWSEALNGSEIKSPSYDSQEFIYEEIHRLLQEGIDDLSQDYEGVKPATDDIIYGGDPEKWLKAAHALKARYYLHLTKRSADLAYDPAEEIMDIIELAISSTEEDMDFPFGYSASEYNPFYSFSLLEYIVPNTTLTSYMSLLNDPRKDFLYKKKFGVATLSGLYYTSSNSPTHMMNYSEVKFIEAEARLRMNEDDPVIEEAFREGIRANILKVTGNSVDSTVLADYLDMTGTLSGSFDQKLERIILQKYLSLYGSIESWTDFRRTGYPKLTPNEGGDHNQNPGGDIPRRFAYPQTERLYNQNFPEELPTLQDRFWWDE